MAVPKFEDQAFYDYRIVDSRVQEVLGLLANDANHRAVTAHEAAQKSQWSQQPSEPEAEVARRDMPKIHTIEGIESTGGDGEDYSGGLCIVGVITPEGKTSGVIECTGWTSHETSLPAQGTSWYLEFTELEVAKTFWKEHWMPRGKRLTFDGNEVIAAGNECIRAGKIKRGAVGFQALGLLEPWFSQRVGEHRLLDAFSTTDTSLVRVPRLFKPDSRLVPGIVYKVPQFEEFSSKANTYKAKTCLTAFEVPHRRLGGWGRSDTEHTSTIVQWSDGEIDHYPNADKVLPAPLTRKDVQRPHVQKPVEPTGEKVVRNDRW